MAWNLIKGEMELGEEASRRRQSSELEMATLRHLKPRGSWPMAERQFHTY